MPTAGLLAGSLRAGCIRRGWLPPGCLSPDSWRSISGRRLATGSLQAPCNKAPGASPAAAGAMRAPVENGASAGARVDAGAAVQGRSRCPSPHWTDPCELPLPFLRANEAPARRPATCGTNWSKLVRPLPISLPGRRKPQNPESPKKSTPSFFQTYKKKFPRKFRSLKNSPKWKVSAKIPESLGGVGESTNLRPSCARSAHVALNLRGSHPASPPPRPVPCILAPNSSGCAHPAPSLGKRARPNLSGGQSKFGHACTTNLVSAL